ncbi:hypothetical protein vBYenM636_03 [Yersinia phage vB_YenM_636]|nr:hypothetical protein vBYenM12_03 [Yersinia phage vB_YenM_12]QKN86345.1 hypothetical protein vBYenM22_03 [Yersinia phage vB_YenM_22]QKN86436.1 hypothetical protein vBYenM25_03 [Yersinia phage vB_YenM_25]QKN86527.1 hypothetical protein vBYenM27_03 [Yersinia phage vB_YenM_27]QKN86618.1 hypothetical protein vBYenM39_03 [Yersinia phage vB_YenM_39]QKN86709.1 hypothetical protein vBYenM126_03 [Yersinia phage vB_YenM_126]QKN86800.1 hypothetical protein vBYenM526-1_03 [Yersinia phage vB_YenM_526-1]
MKLICTKSIVPWFKVGEVHSMVKTGGIMEVMDNDDDTPQWWYVERTVTGYAVKLPNSLTLAEFK